MNLFSVLCLDNKKEPLGYAQGDVTHYFSHPTDLSFKEHFAKGGAVGIVCGQINGNIEVIDVDIKNDTDGTVIANFENACPKVVLKKLAIFETVTPHGKTNVRGRHYYYCISHVSGGGSQVLAKSELGRTIIETRGDNAYIAFSHNYKPVQNGDLINIQDGVHNLPVITKDERDALLVAARECNLFTAENASYGTAEVSPEMSNFIRHYDLSKIITDFGWTIPKIVDNKVYVKRPGESVSPHSGYYLIDRKKLLIFSSSTDFEPGKAYNNWQAFRILSGNKTKGDYPKAAKLLRENYGINILEHPSSVFWRWEEEVKVKKHKDGTEEEQVSHKLVVDAMSIQNYLAYKNFYYFIYNDRTLVGYLLPNKVIKAISNKLDLNSEQIAVVKRLLKEAYPKINSNYHSTLENKLLATDVVKILQQSTPLIINKVKNKDVSKFYFENVIVEIDRSGNFTLTPFSGNTEYVLYEHIKQHTLVFEEFDENTLNYVRFLKKIVKDYNYLRKVLGRICSQVKDASDRRGIVFIDKEATNDANKGRTGKSFTASSLNNFISGCHISGKSFNPYSEQAYQELQQHHQYIHLEDPKSDFLLESLYNAVGSGVVVKKLYTDKYTVPVDEMPDIVVSTNFVPADMHDSSSLGRFYFVAFEPTYSDTFSPLHDPDIGRMFEVWSKEQWNMYYCFMLQSVILYHKEGLTTDESRELALRLTTNAYLLDEFVDFADKHIKEKLTDKNTELRLVRKKFYEEWSSYIGFKGTAAQRESPQFIIKQLELYCRSNKYYLQEKSGNSVYKVDGQAAFKITLPKIENNE